MADRHAGFSAEVSEDDCQAVNPRRAYSINQIEYCFNFIFKRHFPNPQDL
jgi:hypothetical protein